MSEPPSDGVNPPGIVEAVTRLRLPRDDADREKSRAVIFQYLWDRMGDYGANKEYPASLFLANNAEIAWASAAILGDHLSDYVHLNGDKDPGMMRELQIATQTARAFMDSDDVQEYAERRHDIFYEGVRR